MTDNEPIDAIEVADCARHTYRLCTGVWASTCARLVDSGAAWEVVIAGGPTVRIDDTDPGLGDIQTAVEEACK